MIFYWEWNGFIALHQFHIKHKHTEINLFHRDSISNRFLCDYYVENTQKFIRKNLSKSITESIMCSILYIYIYIKTQSQFLVSYLLFTERHELINFSMQNGCKLPDKSLRNVYISSPLAVHGFCGKTGFLSHLSSCACLNCITDNLKWCTNGKVLAYIYGNTSLGKHLKIHEHFHKCLTAAWTLIVERVENNTENSFRTFLCSLSFLNLIFHVFINSVLH